MKPCKALTHKFDYDIGCLVKSPCRDCDTYGMFPDCMDRCAILDRVQTALSDRLSSIHNHSVLESFAFSLEPVERI